ncbi:MAG: hypothetical protein Tsb0033_26920 [Winogradskyella sp.]
MKAAIRYTILVTIVTFFSLYLCNTNAQETEKFVNCNCESVYVEMIQKLETNYIGLKQLQLAKKDHEYIQRKKNFRAKSKNVLPENCTEFLDEFLDFFNDGHLHAIERPKYTDSLLLEFKNEIKNKALNENELQAYENNLAIKVSDSKDNILGYWTDGKSKFITIKSNNVYEAYILETNVKSVEKGELKATIRPTVKGYALRYYSYKYSPVYVRGKLCKDHNVFSAGHVYWKRVDESFHINMEEAIDLKKPSLKIIDPKTTLITIPSFNYDFKSFNDFVSRNEQYIKDSKNLIIDIRGNRGGNGIYFPLIELFATQDMSGSQGLVLASQDNLEYFERKMKYSRRIYKPVVKNIQNNMGKIVDGPEYPKKNYRIRDNLIQNVTILIDKGCASAAESFILHAKRSSDKVTTFGSPTAGMIDYTSVNSLLLDSGSQNILFVYPTSTLHKDIPEKGFNKTGIKPDFAIPSSIENKIAYVMKKMGS